MAVAHLSSATLVTIKVSPPSSQHGDLRFGRAEPGPLGISRPAPVTGQRPRTSENSRRSRHSEDVAAGQGLYRRWLLKPSAQPTLVRNPTPATSRNTRSWTLCAIWQRKFRERCATSSAGAVRSCLHCSARCVDVSGEVMAACPANTRRCSGAVPSCTCGQGPGRFRPERPLPMS